jgi:hypothetical protein
MLHNEILERAECIGHTHYSSTKTAEPTLARTCQYCVSFSLSVPVPLHLRVARGSTVPLATGFKPFIHFSLPEYIFAPLPLSLPFRCSEG